jgi:APA family basic amino acid/polyamine antiporter
LTGDRRSGSSPGCDAPVTLNRSLSLPWLVLYGLGTTIGAGIYALTGVVAGRAGMQAPACFLLASLLALPSALSFAELSSRFPRAAGEATYVREGTGLEWLATLVGLLAVLAGVISAATVCVGFVEYLVVLVPVPALPAVAGVALVIGAVTSWGVRESVTAAGLMTVIEIGGLLAIMAWGSGELRALPERLPEMIPNDSLSLLAVGSGALLAFYAFLGFEDMVNVAEEVQDVRRVLPRAIVLTLVVTAMLYVVLAAIAVIVVPPAELATKGAPLAHVFGQLGGPSGLLGVIALFALLNGALIQVIKSSRVLYGLACQGALPAPLGRIHPRTRTPLLATALATSAVVVLATTFPLEALAEATSIVTLGIFALANLSLVLVKRRSPDAPGAVVYPMAVPIAGCVLSVGIVALEVARRIADG